MKEGEIILTPLLLSKLLKEDPDSMKKNAEYFELTQV